MKFDNETDGLKKRRLCFSCVGEDFLKNAIQTDGTRGKCSYCERTRKTFSIGEMAERMEKAFDEHYIRTYESPTPYESALLADEELDYEWDRAGEEVVAAIVNAAEIPEEAASDIQKLLCEKFLDFEAAKMGDETEFCDGSHYEEKRTDDEFWQMEWTNLERSIKKQARFFNYPAAQQLRAIFDGLDVMKTRDERAIIVEAGPGTSLAALYRARVFQSQSNLEIALSRPDQHIGSPPHVYANAGRMNANGISVFYGATDPTVALAEVRPPVGSQVVVGRFEIIRSIRLLDLTALVNVATGGSIFDSAFKHQLERVMFLKSLSERITKPVMPDDEEFEYLATQAIADFLANESPLKTDGIIFPSVQGAGKALNVVLFHKASKIEPIELPEDTEIRTSLMHRSEDGWEHDYSVVEIVPHKKDGPEKLQQEFMSWDSDNTGSNVDEYSFGRNNTLKIDLDSLKVHIVKAAEFSTEEYAVSRYRREKYNDEF